MGLFSLNSYIFSRTQVIYRSSTSDTQNFSASCETECSEWVKTPSECCKVTGSATFSFTLRGLYPNQTSYFHIKASNGTLIGEPNKEKSVTTGSDPSGMVLVDYLFDDNVGGTYKIYVDFVEAGCVTVHYDSGTYFCNNGGGRATGDLVDPPRPGYPPYVQINYTEALTKCASLTIPDYGVKRLMTWKEFVVASSWTIDPEDVSADGNQAFKSVEDGVLNTDCNTDTRHGGGVDPITNLGSYTTGTTGANSTETCVSYWGAQDMVGNVWEWLIEQIECYGDALNNGYCLGTANDIDNDILGWGFCDDDDGAVGGWSCDYTVGLPRTIDGFLYTNANIQKFDGGELADDHSIVNSFDFGTNFFGITSVTDAGYDPSFNDDRFFRYYDTVTRGPVAGGSWIYATNAGRFNVDYDYALSSTRDRNGFRCVLSVTAN